MKTLKGIVITLVVVIMGLLISCNQTQTKRPGFGMNLEEVRKEYNGNKAKYIFYFIGDGMGMPQISATERYLAALDGKEGQRKLNITKFPNQTMVTTYAEDRFITGSAAAGTALATGNKTTINTISMDGKREKPLKTIAEIAKSEGKKVGIISSVSIDHATPAAFYAHQPTRKMLYEIGLDMIKADFDFYGGGDVVYPRGKDKSASKGDVYEELKKAGYKITRDKNEFKSLNQNSGKVFAISPTLDADKATRYAMDQNPKDDISLKELTIKAVEMFSGNEKGFFVMVEGGKIDWACHANDAAATIHDVLAFDDAVGVAVDFYNKHPEETLIVIVGDHETGGMTLGFSGRQYDSAFEVLKNQKMSYLAFDESVIQPMKNIDGIAKLNKDQLIEKFWSEIYIQIQNNFSLGTDKLPLNEYEINILKDAFAASMLGEKIAPKSDQTYLLYGGYEPLSIKLTTILNQKAGIGWTSYSHTGVPIPAYAMGCGQELFFGYNDNTDVAKNIIAVMSEQN